MQRTIFDTPVVRTLLRWVLYDGMKLLGWRLEGGPPADTPKFVLIAAPHTSNWDLPVMLGAAFGYGIKIHWMGKHTLFRGPLGPFFRWLGGIAINRSAAHNVVAQSVDLFKETDALILAVPPEGTRSKVRHWKTGFYYIAHGATVPIVLGYVDFTRKAAGLGPVMQASSDIEKDMQTIRAFYANIQGKYPELTSQAALPDAPPTKHSAN